ncbi:MAG: C-terminal binding protein [Planctomycetota bacterium]|nr:C-terminal binding protein [Planctomycetota bacterium]
MKKLTVVLVASDLEMPASVPQELSAAGVDFRERICQTSSDVPSACRDADLVWVMGGSRIVTAETLPDLPRCRVLLRTGTGTDNMPVSGATRLGMYVANTPEATTHAVAEHAIGLIFAVARQIVAQDRLVRQGIWDRDRAWPNWSFEGRTLGLVGFGRIAQAVVAKLRGFNLQVVASDPAVSAEVMRDHGAEKVSLEQLMIRSDYISIHAPHLPATYHLIGEPQLRLMKPQAILVNTARGPLIDQVALTEALEQRRIGGAGLDVTESEPLAVDDPLMKLDNVVLTPHIAGYSDEFRRNFWEHSVKTIKAVAAGGPPLWIVNPQVIPRTS